MPRDVLLRFVLCALLIVAPPVTFSAEPSFWRELRDALSTIGDDLTDGVSGKNQRQLLESAIEQLINEAPPTDAEARTQEPVHIDLKEIQARLTALGYAPGPVDGVFGQKTQSAIAEYQADHGLIVDGRATNKLISALRASTVGTELAGIHTEVSPSLAITQSRSYLEQMVAEADAQVHRLANNIDPQTREMARRSGIDIDGMVARQLAGYEQHQREVAEIKRLTSGEAINSNQQPPTSVSSQRSPSSAQLTSDIPSTLAGVWEGNIQFMPHLIKPGTPQSYDYGPMQLIIDPKTNTYITNYPGIRCTGQLFFEKKINVAGDRGRYIFKERLTQQSSNCTDNGVAQVLDPIGGGMLFSWAHPKTNKNAIGGSLTRTSKNIDDHIKLPVVSPAPGNVITPSPTANRAPAQRPAATAPSSAPSEGSSIYISTNHGSIYRWNVASGAVEQLVKTGLALTDIAFDPSGRLFGITADSLYRIDLESGSVVFIGKLRSKNEMYAGGGNLLTTANGLDVSVSGVARITSQLRMVPEVDLGTGILTHRPGYPIGQGGRRHEEGAIWFTDSERYVVTDNSALVFVSPTTLSTPGVSYAGGYSTGEAPSRSLFLSSIKIDAIVGAPAGLSTPTPDGIIIFSENAAYPAQIEATIRKQPIQTFALDGRITGAALTRVATVLTGNVSAAPAMPDGGASNVTPKVEAAQERLLALSCGAGASDPTDGGFPDSGSRTHFSDQDLILKIQATEQLFITQKHLVDLGAAAADIFEIVSDVKDVSQALRLLEFFEEGPLSSLAQSNLLKANMELGASLASALAIHLAKRLIDEHWGGTAGDKDTAKSVAHVLVKGLLISPEAAIAAFAIEATTTYLALSADAQRYMASEMQRGYAIAHEIDNITKDEVASCLIWARIDGFNEAADHADAVSSIWGQFNFVGAVLRSVALILETKLQQRFDFAPTSRSTITSAQEAFLHAHIFHCTILTGPETNWLANFLDRFAEDIGINGWKRRQVNYLVSPSWGLHSRCRAP